MSFVQEKFNQSHSHTSVIHRSSSVSLVPWSAKCHNFHLRLLDHLFSQSYISPSNHFWSVSCHVKGFISAFPWQIYSRQHQHIIQELDWETPNSTLDLHASMAGILVIDSRFTSLTSDRRMLLSVRLQSNLFTFDEMCWDTLEIIVINGDSPRTC